MTNTAKVKFIKFIIAEYEHEIKHRNSVTEQMISQTAGAGLDVDMDSFSFDEEGPANSILNDIRNFLKEG